MLGPTRSIASWARSASARAWSRESHVTAENAAGVSNWLLIPHERW